MLAGLPTLWPIRDGFCDRLYDVEIRRVICSTDEIVNIDGLTWRLCGPRMRSAAAA
jgi:hypothetical protein